ncbi:FHA domain-containing protein [Paenibacillus sp. FSL K6-1230]|uniref:FHA domain-containing protein n=1 Tax=Paenibacillus sp. FSL K6-1230 TaxID=2921603 RepID=UPI0030FB3806
MQASRSRWIIGLDIAVFVLLAAVTFYTFFRSGYVGLKIGVATGAILCTLVYLVGSMVTVVPAPKPEKRVVSKLVQLDDEGEPVKEWYIQGETALLIGKIHASSEVDIDLSDSEYASLISSEHAVLNRVGEKWFVEDTDSANGTGLREANSSLTDKLESGEPRPIHPGDLLFIANTRLLIK